MRIGSGQIVRGLKSRRLRTSRATPCARLHARRCVRACARATTFALAIHGVSALSQSIAPADSAPAQTSQTTQTQSTPSNRADVNPSTPLSTTTAPQGNSSTTPSPTTTDTSRALTDHRPLDEAVRGVVTNEVITLVGQDFYGAFVSAWRDVPLSDRYNVSVYERPSARWGSLVWVEYEHRRLFEAFLPPTRTGIKEIGARAANATYQKLVQADLDRLLFKDPDLAPDEM